MEQKSKKEMLINSNYFEIKQLHRQATLHPRSFVLIAYKRNFGPLHLMQKTAEAGAKCPRSGSYCPRNILDAPAYLPPASAPILPPVFLRALFYANFTAVFSAISIISVKLSWRSCAERATGLKR